MSTRCEHYLIVGKKLSIPRTISDELSEKWNDSKLHFPWCGKNAVGKFGILEDAMSGRYIVAGKCLAVSDDECQNTFDCITVKEPTLGQAIDVSDWLYANDLTSYAEDEVQTYLITHWH